MQIKTTYNMMAHLIGVLAICLLLGFIMQVTRKGRNDKILCTELIATFDTGLRGSARVNDGKLKRVSDNSLKDPIEINQMALEWAKKLQAHGDSIDVMIDSLSKYPEVQLARAVGKMLKLYPTFISNLMRNNPKPSKELQMLLSWGFSSLDSTYCWLEYPPNKFSQQQLLVLSKIRSTIKLVNATVLYYCESIEGFEIACPGAPYPTWDVNTLNPTVGDKVDIAVFLSADSREKYFFEYWLNGQELQDKDGVVKYKTRFSKPGLHPVHLAIKVTNPLTDSVRVLEKTYFVRVQE